MKWLWEVSHFTSCSPFLTIFFTFSWKWRVKTRNSYNELPLLLHSDDGPVLHGLDTLIHYYQEDGHGQPFRLGRMCVGMPPPHDTRKHGRTNLLHRAAKEGLWPMQMCIQSPRLCRHWSCIVFQLLLSLLEKFHKNCMAMKHFLYYFPWIWKKFQAAINVCSILARCMPKNCFIFVMNSSAMLFDPCLLSQRLLVSNAASKISSLTINSLPAKFYPFCGFYFISLTIPCPSNLHW